MDPVNFPRDLRDDVYEFALTDNKPIAIPIHLDRYEKGTRDFGLHHC